MMSNQQQLELISLELDEIKKLRQQLSQFNSAEGSLEVVFSLPSGESVRVPVSKKAKIELLSKEVRNYLAEEQLAQQDKVNV